MLPEMRRSKQALPSQAIDEILKNGTSGVLALSGDEGYPYALPISYVYDGEKIYFHCAKQGHKLNAIRRNPKASFCVVDKDQIVPEEYTTYFRSVIAFGEIRILQDEDEKRSAIEKLAIKYHPSHSAQGRKEAIDKEWAPLCLLEMTINHLTGKEARELAKNRE